MKTDEILAQKYDALNQILTLATVKLKQLKPIHSVFIEYDEQIVGFMKFDGKWTIVYGTDSGYDSTVALNTMPVEIRVSAAAQIPRLYDAILQSKKDYIPLIESTIDRLQKFLDNVN